MDITKITDIGELKKLGFDQMREHDVLQKEVSRVQNNITLILNRIAELEEAEKDSSSDDSRE